MAEESWLAFDIGAESGRAFLGSLRAGGIQIREIHRFPNEPVEYGGRMHWDAPRIWLEMQRGLAAVGDTPLAGIGVDTWGVDYALLDRHGELLRNPYHARDPRNIKAMEDILARVSREEIYGITGIQFMPINTLNQLYAAQSATPELLRAADKLIMMPDLFHFWMTGNAVCEYTDASTTQFMNVATRTWATDLLESLGLPSRLPAEIVEPGTVVGKLAGTPVIAPASHDTASAVAAIAARGDTAFISSGTWSLIGTELIAPIVSAEALRLNFTNEGGVCGTTRLLKNSMGLWMLQCCRRAWARAGREYSYAELTAEAVKAAPLRSLTDPDHLLFLNPPNMPAAIVEFCHRTDQPEPRTPGEFTRAILESLALRYRGILRSLERLTGNKLSLIRVIGGGSQNTALNQFTADATGLRVIAGPKEASVLGNIGVQMMATRAVSSLEELRGRVANSFHADVYEPANSAAWDAVAARFDQYADAMAAANCPAAPAHAPAAD